MEEGESVVSADRSLARPPRKEEQEHHRFDLIPPGFEQTDVGRIFDGLAGSLMVFNSHIIRNLDGESGQAAWQCQYTPSDRQKSVERAYLLEVKGKPTRVLVVERADVESGTKYQYIFPVGEGSAGDPVIARGVLIERARDRSRKFFLLENLSFSDPEKVKKQINEARESFSTIAQTVREQFNTGGKLCSQEECAKVYERLWGGSLANGVVAVNLEKGPDGRSVKPVLWGWFDGEISKIPEGKQELRNVEIARKLVYLMSQAARDDENTVQNIRELLDKPDGCYLCRLSLQTPSGRVKTNLRMPGFACPDGCHYLVEDRYGRVKKHPIEENGLFAVITTSGKDNGRTIVFFPTIAVHFLVDHKVRQPLVLLRALEKFPDPPSEFQVEAGQEWLAQTKKMEFVKEDE